MEVMIANIFPLSSVLWRKIHSSTIHIRLTSSRFNSWNRKIHWRRDGLPTPVFLGFPCGSAGKEFTCGVGDLGSVLELGRPPGEGNSYPLQHSGLENSMDCTVHGVTKSQTQLSDFHFIHPVFLQSSFILLRKFLSFVVF